MTKLRAYLLQRQQLFFRHAPASRQLISPGIGLTLAAICGGRFLAASDHGCSRTVKSLGLECPTATAHSLKSAQTPPH